MNACKRIARVVAGLVFVTSVGVIVVGLDIVPGSNELLASAMDSQVAYEQSLIKSQYLDEQLQIEQRVAKAKEGITADVIAGRVTLVEAAALFTSAETELNSQLVWVRLNLFPGNSDAERQCRKVISHVELALTDETSSERDLLINRLTAELQNELQRNGGVVTLPDSDTVRRQG